MKSSVSLCSAILLPVLSLAIPLSDASANAQQSVDAANTAQSSAFDTPFASAHQLGHGPVVVSTPISTAPLSSSTSDVSNGSTYYRHTNRTVVHQTYECDQRVHIDYLIGTVLLNRAQGNPGCRLVANASNGTASASSSTPSQNLSNPAYIGGGEAAAPPGYRPSSSLESSTTTDVPSSTTTDVPSSIMTGVPSSTTTGGNTTDETTMDDATTEGTTTGGNMTMVDVRIEQVTHGTEITTTIRIKQHMNTGISPLVPDTALATYNDTATPAMSPPVDDTPNLPESTSSAPAPSRRPGTPYALPPGFTGP